MFKKTISFAALVLCASAAVPADLVPELPGMDVFTLFDMYSGYLAIPDTTTKQLHYVFVTSQSSTPTTDPVIVWFNGGPGCSSMLGWAQEHGPYVMESGDTTFHYNDYSWNQEANVLYIESPGGVGYSICGSPAECTFDDDTSAADNLQVLLDFFVNKFPEYGTNDLYISGESYAGIYVPYLVNQIDTYNTASTGFKFNLKGFMVGNGCTNWSVDTTPAYMEMAYWHGLYDDALYNTITTLGCEQQFAATYTGKLSADCLKAYSRFAQLTADVNVYDVYGICYQDGGAAKNNEFELYPSQEMRLTKVGNSMKAYKTSYTSKDYTPWLYRNQNKKNLQELPPCTFGTPLIEYFNDPTVRDLLHITPVTDQAWDMCTSGISYTSGYDTGSQWIYTNLKGKYRTLFYSGDTDGAVPTYGSMAWIAQMGYTTKTAWGPFMVQGQVGGYFEEYEENFTFATVHGAGHMVPQDKRPEGYYLIFNWLNENPLA